MHNHNHGDQVKEPLEQIREAVSLMQGIAVLLALPMLLLYRNPGTAGRHFFGGRLMMAMIAMFVVITLGGSGDDEVPIYFTSALLVCAFIHNVAGARARRRGYLCHSFYGGDSCFHRMVGDRRAKAGVEPFVTLILAILAIPLSPGIALYLLAAGFAMAALSDIERRQQEARVQASIDAQHEALILAEDIRRYRNGW